jgi:hypothetical protein
VPSIWWSSPSAGTGRCEPSGPTTRRLTTGHDSAQGLGCNKKSGKFCGALKMKKDAGLCSSMARVVGSPSG